jgi:hypothetical protein
VWSWPVTSINTEVNTWSYTSTPTYVKHRDSITFTLPSQLWLLLLLLLLPHESVTELWGIFLLYVNFMKGRHSFYVLCFSFSFRVLHCALSSMWTSVIWFLAARDEMSLRCVT